MGSTKVVALLLIATVVMFAACVELGEAYYVYDVQCYKACYPKRCLPHYGYSRCDIYCKGFCGVGH